MKAEFRVKFESFLAGCQKLIDDADLAIKTKLEVRNDSAKYIAIDCVDRDSTGKIISSPVFCFVVQEDGFTKALGVLKAGDVLKAASWKMPAKHARGNIFDENNGLKYISRFGPAYLNHRGNF